MQIMNAQTAGRVVTEKTIIWLLLCTACALFLFNETFRQILNKGDANYYFNVLYICFGSLAIGALFRNELVEIGAVLISMAFIGGAIITLTAGGKGLFQYSLVIPSLVIPLLTITFRLPDSLFEPLLEKIIKGLNVLCLILVITAIIDYFAKGAIQVYGAQHFYRADLASLIKLERASGIYRYYSFWGHPLVNSWYILLFYTLNISFNKYFRPLLNEYLLTIVTLIGLLLCGSRTALTLALFMIIFLNNNKYKAAFYLALSVAVSGLAMTPIFQKNLMQRFLIGSKAGADFSGGRNIALSRVVDGFSEPPAIFFGGGYGYSWSIVAIMGGFIRSFEYPFIMFAYDFGIFGTILIYLIILLIPSVILVKNKCYFLLLQFLCISIYMNGFNGLALYGDNMGQFCFFTMIMVNMSYLIKRRQQGGVET